MKALCALLLTVGLGASGAVSCGAGGWGAPEPVATWPRSTPEPWVLPMVAAWRAERPVVEALIEGQGPFLFAVDLATPDITLAQPIATAVGVTWQSNLRGEAHGRLRRLTLGAGSPSALELTDLRIQAVDPLALGSLHGRPIAGVVGARALGDRVVEFDPDAGVIRLWRKAPPAGLPGERPGDDGQLIPLERHPGPHWTLALPIEAPEVADHTASEAPPPTAEGLLLAPGSPYSGLTREAARTHRLPEHPLGFAARLGFSAVGGVALRLIPVTPDQSHLNGVVGYDLLGRHRVRVDTAHDQLWWWPAPATRGAALNRFPGRPACGSTPTACLTGVVAEGPGAGRQVSVRLTPPSPPWPLRYWWRINLARPGEAPVTRLLQVHPKPPLPPVAHFDLTPTEAERALPPGRPVRLLDVVPLGEDCQGVVCVRP